MGQPLRIACAWLSRPRTQRSRFLSQESESNVFLIVKRQRQTELQSAIATTYFIIGADVHQFQALAKAIQLQNFNVPSRLQLID